MISKRAALFGLILLVSNVILAAEPNANANARNDRKPQPQSQPKPAGRAAGSPGHGARDTGTRVASHRSAPAERSAEPRRQGAAETNPWPGRAAAAARPRRRLR